MKKLVSFLLALVLTLSLTTEALAAVVSPKADATEITADQTVKLTVTASEDEKLTGIVCLNYRVYFDPAFFELDTDASVAKFEGAKLTALKTDDRGSYYAVSLLDTTSAGLTVSGDLYTLAFKVKDGASVGDTSKLTLVKAYVYTIEDGAMKPMDNGAVENGEVTVKIVASAAPANVTLGSAKAVSGGIQVTWQAASGAEKYNVYRKDASNTVWRVIATVTGTSYTDKSGTAGTKYSYTVRGVAADGKTLSPGYNKTGVSATVPKAAAVPAEVKMGDATARGSYITVDWSRAANASAYRVYRRINNSTDWRIVASSVNGTSYTDWNVEPGVRYSYTVRGIAADGKTLSRTYDRVGVFAFARISADNLANDSVLKIFPIEDVPYNLTRMNWDYLLYFYKGDTIEQLPSEFGGQLRLLFNNDGTAYLVTGNGVGRGMYNADKLVISIVFPGSDIPLVYVATFTQLDGKTYLFLMPDISGRDALVFGALSYR